MAREGDRGTKMKGGGGPEIKYWENPEQVYRAYACVYQKCSQSFEEKRLVIIQFFILMMTLKLLRFFVMPLRW